MANKKANANQIIENNYIDLLYMTPSEITAKEIALLLQNSNELTIDLWEEMNVLELQLPNQSSVDFEPLAVNFDDPSDASFVKNRNIQTIFILTLYEEDIQTAAPYFEQIVDKFSGFICADSEDFSPVYAGSSKR